MPPDLELALRLLPGVVSVGTTARGAPGGPQLDVVTLHSSDAVHVAVGRRTAERFGPGAVPVATVVVPAGPPGTLGGSASTERAGAPVVEPRGPEVPAPSVNVGDGWSATTELAHPPGAAVTPPATPPAAANGVSGAGAPDRRPVPAGPARRVVLEHAGFDPATGTSEVALARGERRATGRAAAGPLAGGAQATLSALGALGLDVPFYLRSADRARDVPGEPVVVGLEWRGEETAAGGRMGRMGVAVGDGEVEAASRATLGALNRYLTAEPRTAP